MDRSGSVAAVICAAGVGLLGTGESMVGHRAGLVAVTALRV